MVQAFTRSPATVDGERGGKFRLLEGNVFGEFTELVRLAFLFWETYIFTQQVYRYICTNGNDELSLLQVPDEKIVMKWRFNNWPCGRYYCLDKKKDIKKIIKKNTSGTVPCHTKNFTVLC